MARNPRPPRHGGAGAPPPADNPSGTPRDIGRPVFAQPEPTEHPTAFRVKHPSDQPIYQEIDALMGRTDSQEANHGQSNC